MSAIDQKRFEDLVFNRHFISTIKHTGLGGCCELMPDPAKCLPQAELMAKDGKGNYVREDVSAMWFGWNLHAKEVRRKCHEIKKDLE